MPVWTFQTGVLDGFECTPLVIDGIMYITTPWNHAYAVDCQDGLPVVALPESLPETWPCAATRSIAASPPRATGST